MHVLLYKFVELKTSVTNELTKRDLSWNNFFPIKESPQKFFLEPFRGTPFSIKTLSKSF